MEQKEKTFSFRRRIACMVGNDKRSNYRYVIGITARIAYAFPSQYAR